MPLVFIIDDDSAALSSVVSLLTACQYEVRAFNSAEAFLASGETTERGCLVCDVRLPGMSGLELQSTLKSRGIQLPVILVSGYADLDTVTKALEDGVVRVLEKPVDPDVLLEHVETAIQIAQ